MKKIKEKIFRFIITGAVFVIVQLTVFPDVCFPQQENLQIAYSRNLEFRRLIPGIRKTVTETSPDAGKFVIRNYGGRCIVNLSFNLSGNISSGADFAPVVFNATYSADPNDNQPGIPFNPYSGTTLAFDDKTREYYIRIGGTVIPRSIQGAGDYSTPVIIILTTLND